MDNDLARRERVFADGYDGLEARDILGLIRATGDWLERLLFDKPAVDAAMRTLFDVVIGSSEIADRPAGSWRELWDGPLSSHEFDIRGAQYFVSLHRFAFYGLRPDAAFLDSDEHDLATVVEGFVSAGRALIDVTPAGWADLSNLEQTVLAAEGRLNLDLDRGAGVDQIASLARVSVKSVRNMLTPKGGTSDLRLGVDGRIGAQDALRWLRRRSDFEESSWRSGEPGEAEDALPSDEDLAEVAFVPVAKDGTAFDAETCRRDGRGYTVGPKEREEHYSDYRQALDRLARMATPRWRRPNPQGHWGIVTGISWVRRTAPGPSVRDPS